MYYKTFVAAVCRVCADGAANVMHDFQADHSTLSYVPDIICGDMDSIRPKVLTHYKVQGSEILSSSCQDTTDFTKCVSELLQRRGNRQLQFDQIIAVGSTGGRLDHLMAMIQTLFLFPSDSLPPIFIVAAQSVTFLLQPGNHCIKVSCDMVGSDCGLIPVAQPCHSVTTSGLKWNLYGQRMAFGELISTSNCITDSVVYVKTDQPLLWTMTTLS